MIKYFYISVVTIVLAGIILTPQVFALDSRMIHPVLSHDAVTTSYGSANKTDDNELTPKTPQVFAVDSRRIPPVSPNDAVFIPYEPVDRAEEIKAEEEELAEDLLNDFEEFDDTVELQLVADPLYYFNYAMYSFNDFMYFAAIKPIAAGYKKIMPTIVRVGVNNFFHNLLFPVRFVNNILQGEIIDAGTEFQIFLINSTIGVLGFSQMAQNEFNLQTSDEDFGQTLGSYSIGNGFYLVLPFWGPTTLRDAIGLAGDYFLAPISYVEPWDLRLGIRAYDALNIYSFRLGDYEAIKDSALDPYVSLRNAYIQNRIKEIRE